MAIADPEFRDQVPCALQELSGGFLSSSLEYSQSQASWGSDAKDDHDPERATASQKRGGSNSSSSSSSRRRRELQQWKSPQHRAVMAKNLDDRFHKVLASTIPNTKIGAVTKKMDARRTGACSSSQKPNVKAIAAECTLHEGAGRGTSERRVEVDRSQGSRGSPAWAQTLSSSFWPSLFGQCCRANSRAADSVEASEVTVLRSDMEEIVGSVGTTPTLGCNV
mmetsp:Transcript_82817/g.208574  ORF Transcript_82817/g.208574 Transcript_82817/m.208574 type:complete len:222 (+) Transcript_82817:37-702(+)